MPADHSHDDHVHGPDCGHDHSHDHDPQQNPDAPMVAFANALIDMANKRIEAGLAVEEVASGLRHAAANFSAYGFFRSEEYPKDPNHIVEEFVRYLEYYLERHKPAEPAASGFQGLIDQAKGEL